MRRRTRNGGSSHSGTAPALRGGASIASTIGGAVLIACVVGVGCSHDLDALKSDLVLRGGSDGTGTSSGKGGSGKGGASGQDKPDGGGMGVERDAGLDCAPCEPLSAPAKALGLRGCCRGTLGNECGLTFADGTLCLPRAVPAQESAACDGLTVGDMDLAGCCRPDGRCGVSADGLGLGCVARDEVAPVRGGTPQPPVACDYACAADTDCNSVLSGYVCTESDDHSQRACARSCKRDQDCPRTEICGLSNDQGMDRVLTVCRPPIGAVAPAEFCSAAKDCVHGICLMADKYCTKLCVNPGDCGADFTKCNTMSMIPTPSQNKKQFISICLR